MHAGLTSKSAAKVCAGFYDKILPSFINKYAKKWGAKVEEGNIASGWKLVSDNGKDVGGPYRDRAEAEQGAQARSFRTTIMPEHQAAHSVDITPAMRESVMQGQPLFTTALPIPQIGQQPDDSGSSAPPQPLL